MRPLRRASYWLAKAGHIEKQQDRHNKKYCSGRQHIACPRVIRRFETKPAGSIFS